MSERLRHAHGPPLEAYSRVTNADRFRPLHDIALERLNELQSTFDVQRTELDRPDPDIRLPLARPSIRLEPTEPVAAPIVVSFTEFPGLYVRCGRWLLKAFPSCGCDACSESVEDERERFLALVENVVAGHLHESIEIPTRGDARLQWGAGSTGDGGWTTLGRERARELIGTGPSSFTWQAWPRR